MTSLAAVEFLLCLTACGKASYTLLAGAMPGVLYSQFVRTCNSYSYSLVVLITSVEVSSLPSLLCELN